MEGNLEMEQSMEKDKGRIPDRSHKGRSIWVLATATDFLEKMDGHVLAREPPAVRAGAYW